MDGFRFNTARGQAATLQMAPPFAFNDVTMSVFPLRASLPRLTAFCDSYLNQSDIVEFRPFVPFVYLVILDYGRMSLQAANTGWVSQREVAFGIPMRWLDIRYGRREFRDWAFTSPFIFVDNEMSMSTGREVYGWPKLLARLDPTIGDWVRDPHGARRVFQVSTKRAIRAYEGQDREYRPFLSVFQAQNGGLLDMPADLGSLVRPITQLPSTLAGMTRLTKDLISVFGGMAADRITGSPVAPDLLDMGQVRQLLSREAVGEWTRRDNWLPGLKDALWSLFPRTYANTINFKQFRDAAHPEAACYQAVTSAKMPVKALKRGGFMGPQNMLLGQLDGGYRVDIHHLAGLPVVDTLGLEVEEERESDGQVVSSLAPVCPFWLEVDMTYGLADTLAWRGRDGLWLRGVDLPPEDGPTGDGLAPIDEPSIVAPTEPLIDEFRISDPFVDQVGDALSDPDSPEAEGDRDGDAAEGGAQTSDPDGVALNTEGLRLRPVVQDGTSDPVVEPKDPDPLDPEPLDPGVTDPKANDPNATEPDRGPILGGPAKPGIETETQDGANALDYFRAMSYFNTTIGGAAAVGGGFSMPNAALRVLPLKADPKRLETFVRGYLNVDQKMRFEPWGDTVYMVVAEFENVTSQLDAVSSARAREIAFCVPVKAYTWFDETRELMDQPDPETDNRAVREQHLDRGVQNLVTTGFVTPFNFVDDVGVAITMSEVIGVPTIQSDITSPENDWLALDRTRKRRGTALLETTAQVLPAVGVGAEGRPRQIFQLHQAGHMPGAASKSLQEMTYDWGHVLADDMARKYYERGQSRAHRRRDVEGLEPMAGLMGFLLQIIAGDMPINQFSLKQFRDANKTTDACYQGLVSNWHRIRRLRDLRGLTAPLQVTISEYPTLPVVETLGLIPKYTYPGPTGPKHVLEAVRPFSIRADLERAEGVTMFERIGDETAWRAVDQPEMLFGPEINDAGDLVAPRKARAVPTLTRMRALSKMREQPVDLAAFLKQLRAERHYRDMPAPEVAGLVELLSPATLAAIVLSEQWGLSPSSQRRDRRRADFALLPETFETAFADQLFPDYERQGGSWPMTTEDAEMKRSRRSADVRNLITEFWSLIEHVDVALYWSEKLDVAADPDAVATFLKDRGALEETAGGDLKAPEDEEELLEIMYREIMDVVQTEGEVMKKARELIPASFQSVETEIALQDRVREVMPHLNRSSKDWRDLRDGMSALFDWLKEKLGDMYDEDMDYYAGQWIGLADQHLGAQSLHDDHGPSYYLDVPHQILRKRLGRFAGSAPTATLSYRRTPPGV